MLSMYKLSSCLSPHSHKSATPYSLLFRFPHKKKEGKGRKRLSLNLLREEASLRYFHLYLISQKQVISPSSPKSPESQIFFYSWSHYCLLQNLRSVSED